MELSHVTVGYQVLVQASLAQRPLLLPGRQARRSGLAATYGETCVERRISCRILLLGTPHQRLHQIRRYIRRHGSRAKSGIKPKLERNGM